MARGDRFKNKLPKFIGQIPDFADLFYAEDQEFERAEKRIQDVILSSYISTVRDMDHPEEVLARLEEIYGIEYDGASTEDRISRLLGKLSGRATTTRELIVSLCASFGYRVRFIPRYPEYGFTLEVYESGLGDIVIDRIEEIKPAHLNFDIRPTFTVILKIKSGLSQHHFRLWRCGEEICGDVPWRYFEGQVVGAGLKATTGNYNGLRAPYYPGDEEGHRAGQLTNREHELLLMQDSTREIIYDVSFPEVEEG